MSNDAPRLPTTTILELAQNSNAVVKENGDYTVQFPEPVTINEGDQLNIKMVSIDSQDADSESIVLPLDGVVGTGSTAISIGFSFYDMNYELENGYSTENKVFRKKYDPNTAGAGTQYLPDCLPYQPYGSIQESKLDEVTVVWSKKYTNGHAKGHGDAGQFRQQLNGFDVKLGFTWYEPTNDGGSIFRTSDINSNSYVFSGSTSYTSKKKKDRPTSIPVGTKQTCTLASGPPIRFKNGSLQVHSITVIVRNTDRRYSDKTIADGNSYLTFQSQQDTPNNPLLPVVDNGLTFTAGGTTFTVKLSSSPTGALTNGDVYSLTGVVGTGTPEVVQDIPIDTLNREHILVSHTTAAEPVLTFNVLSSATATAGTGGGAAMFLQKAGRVELIQGTQTIELPNGRYDRQSMAAAITEGFSQVFLGTDQNRFEPAVHFEPRTSLQFRTQTSEYGAIRFRKMEQFAASGDIIEFNDTNSYTYDRSGGGAVTDEDPVNMLIGARRFSMTYGRNGNIYQWDNGHTSVANPASLNPTGADAVVTASETVGYFQIGTNQFCQVNTATGIIISDMEPKQFWDDTLGLYNNCVVPLQTGKDTTGLIDIAYVGSNALIDNVPKGSSQLQSFTLFNSRYPLASDSGIPTLTAPVFTDVAGVPPNPVLGETPVVIGAGYYLVEIKSLNLAQSQFIDHQENRGHISAIVSTQYNANDSITGFADAGIPYVHRGAPQLISSANVRILDPDTKLVPINLGSRNTVFLQVDSTAPVYTGTPTGAKNMNKPTQNQLQGM
jgi:hypothetical protein